MNPSDGSTEGVRERIMRLRDALTRTRKIGALERLEAYVAGFSSGDRLILYTLGALVSIASIVNLYALEQSLLVRIPADGGVLVEGEVGSPRFVNPLLAISDADRDLTALTYAGLMGIAAATCLAMRRQPAPFMRPTAPALRI